MHRAVMMAMEKVFQRPITTKMSLSEVNLNMSKTLGKKTWFEFSTTIQYA